VVSRADRCCVCDPIDHGGSSFPVASPPIFVFCGAFQNRQLARSGFLTPRSSCSRPTGRSRSQAGLIPGFGMRRKRRKSVGKRRGSCFSRDLWGRTASARDTTTTHYRSHRRRAGGEPVKTTKGSPGRPGSPRVALGGPRQATGKGKGGERGSRGERGSQRGRGAGNLHREWGTGKLAWGRAESRKPMDPAKG
jgi:hypothetical protein